MYLGAGRYSDILTGFLCDVMTAKIEKPLGIVKAATACFKNNDTKKRFVDLGSNKRVWMTSYTMADWLRVFSVKMKHQIHHILFSSYNTTCHPHIQLSNVQLV